MQFAHRKTSTALLVAAFACLALAGAAGGSPVPRPANDSFANATPLSGQTATVTGDTNAGATLEPGEPATVAGSTGGASVWYVWTASLSGRIVIDTANSDFDTLLAVYTGSAVNALTEVASSDDYMFAPDGTSRIALDAHASTTYHIRVDGGGGGDTGTIGLRLAPAPSNDDFANAATLAGSSGTQLGSNTFATAEDGEPDVAGISSAGQSLWYQWTAPSSGHAHVDLEGSAFDTLLGVYTGTAVGNLSEVASNDDAVPGDMTSAVAFDAAGGTTYRIDVNGYNYGGSIALNWACTCAPGAPALALPAAGDAAVALSWAAPPSNGGGPITAYRVYRGTTSGSESLIATVGAVTGYTDNGLTNGATYYYRVSAVNAAGEGAQSVERSTAPVSVPGAPTITSATAGNASAVVTWTAPSSDGGSPISGYDVTTYVNGVALGTTSLGVVTQATITGLANGTVHTFRVAARNAVGVGPQSSGSGPVTPSASLVTLTVSRSGTGTGTVSSSIGGIVCGTTCSANLGAGTTVTLTAVAGASSTFAGWSGACSGTGSCTVTLDATTTIGAVFTAKKESVRPPTRCVVPNVKRKPLATAKRRILAAHCAVGRIVRTASKAVRAGYVSSQSPRPGTRLPKGAKVKLVVSRGRR